MPFSSEGWKWIKVLNHFFCTSWLEIDKSFKPFSLHLTHFLYSKSRSFWICKIWSWFKMMAVPVDQKYFYCGIPLYAQTLYAFSYVPFLWKKFDIFNRFPFFLYHFKYLICLPCWNFFFFWQKFSPSKSTASMPKEAETTGRRMRCKIYALQFSYIFVFFLWGLHRAQADTNFKFFFFFKSLFLF